MKDLLNRLTWPALALVGIALLVGTVACSDWISPSDPETGPDSWEVYVLAVSANSSEAPLYAANVTVRIQGDSDGPKLTERDGWTPPFTLYLLDGQPEPTEARVQIPANSLFSAVDTWVPVTMEYHERLGEHVSTLKVRVPGRIS